MAAHSQPVRDDECEQEEQNSGEGIGPRREPTALDEARGHNGSQVVTRPTNVRTPSCPLTPERRMGKILGKAGNARSGQPSKVLWHQ